MAGMPRSRNLFWPAAGASVFAVTVIALACWHDSSRGVLQAPPNRPITAQERNYVTSNSCRACHPGNYASWHASFHRTMTQVATATTLILDARDIELSFAGRQYKLERRGDSIFASDRSLGEKEYGL